MGTRLDWTKADKPKPHAREPMKAARLDRAADNWLDHGSLCKQAHVEPPPKKKKRHGHKP